MIDLVLFAIGFALIAYAFYKWATQNDNYWADRGVKSLKPYFMVGNTGGFFSNKYSQYGFVTYLYNIFPAEKIFGLFDFRSPFLFVRDPEMIKKLAIKDFDHFQDHKSLLDERSDILFGNSLFMLHGDKWRDMRATLSPAFTGSKMRQMFDLVGETAQDMSEYFTKKSTDSGAPLQFEMKELFSKYTNDVIASSAFGIKVNSFADSKNEFFVTGSKMLNFAGLKSIVKLLMSRMVPRLMQLLGIQFLDSSASKFFKSMVLDTIDTRTKQQIFRPDMINILMQIRNGTTTSASAADGSDIGGAGKDDGFATVEESAIGMRSVRRQWNDNEIVAQCFLFFVAGFDTSSTLLTFSMYELAMNTEIQERLYAECVATQKKLGGGRLTYDELQRMTYMDQVISETLRLWPPAPVTDRLCVRDYEYDDGHNRLRIERGTAIWIPIYGLHMDEKYFPNANQFDPDRFSDERKGNILAGTYLPFGVGPRNCIGSRFALMEAKAVIYYLLLNFKFIPYARTQIPLRLAKSAASIKAEKGVHLQMVPRV